MSTPRDRDDLLAENKVLAHQSFSFRAALSGLLALAAKNGLEGAAVNRAKELLQHESDSAPVAHVEKLAVARARQKPEANETLG